MKKEFKKEFGKNMVYGLFGIGIMLIFFTGYYIHAVSIDFDKECSSCVTRECMDYDGTCGDFGLYWYKLLALTGMGVVGLSILIVVKGESVNG